MANCLLSCCLAVKKLSGGVMVQQLGLFSMRNDEEGALVAGAVP
jgi:hypothetical protein